MRQIRKVNAELTARLGEALALLTPEARSVFETCSVSVCNVRSGRGYFRTRQATIPAWAFNDEANFCGRGRIPLGIKFVAYYLAHELAHIKAACRGHTSQFYNAFRELCPTELQHYELIYMPRNAAACGISQS